MPENDVFADLLRQGVRQSLAAGSPLFAAGDRANTLYYLCEGAVKLFGTEAAGAESVLHVLRAGDLVGLSALIEGRAYALGADALEPTTVIALRRADVLRWLNDHPTAALQALARLGERYRAMMDDLLALKVLTPRQRLCRYLVQVIGDAPATGPAQAVLTERHALIAARIGLSPENLSRAFTRLRSDGVVLTHRRVVVADMQNLRLLADGGDSGVVDCADFRD